MSGRIVMIVYAEPYWSYARLDSNSNRIHREHGDKLFTDLTILNSPLHGGNTVRFAIDVSIKHCKAKAISDSSISQI